MFKSQITFVFFDNKAYSNNFIIFLLTKYIVTHCFPILDF